MADLAGDWRWGLRVTPFLSAGAVILMIFFMEDPERGEHPVIKGLTLDTSEG